jgi:hypothetical protein
MRKVKGLIWMMMMAVALTACSSSDDEENVPLTINTLSGEYIGEATGTLVSINEKGEQRSSDVTPQGTETAKITVNDDGTLTLRQPTFYVGKGAYPGAIIYNIPAKLANNVITFSIKDYGSMNGVYTVAGDLVGEYKDNRLVLDYTFKHAGSMVGTIHFEGLRK